MATPSTLSRPESPDLERIDELFEAWIGAVTAGDPARMARLHVPRGIFQHPGGRGVRGREAIRDACARWLAGGATPNLMLFETRLYKPAGVATANGRFSVAGGGPEISAAHATGRLLLVAEQSYEGWGLRFSGLFSDAFLQELDRLIV